MDYEQAALHQGHIAVNSILRDWLKGQVTAIECGILSFEAVFMPYMLTADGRPLIERIKDENLLPAPQEQKVVSMRGRRRNKPVDPRRAVGFLEDVLALVGFFRLLGCAPPARPQPRRGIAFHRDLICGHSFGAGGIGAAGGARRSCTLQRRAATHLFTMLHWISSSGLFSHTHTVVTDLPMATARSPWREATILADRGQTPAQSWGL